MRTDRHRVRAEWVRTAEEKKEREDVNEMDGVET